jgi:fibronectin type 3 domain-containing protein
MDKPLYSQRAQRGVCQFSFVILAILPGCGKFHSLYAQKEPDNPHSATITWTASTSSVAGYNVYRESQSGPATQLTNGLVPGTQYTDKTVEAGHTYSYFVKSVDSKGVESGPSEKITVTIPTTATPPTNK